MDVLRIFRHLTEEMGFWEVGLAPVTTQEQRDYAITSEGKDNMLEQFEILAQEWLECALNDEHHGFSNVKDTLEEIHKGVSKAYGCGAGLGLMGVATDGDVSLCHRFAGSPAPLAAYGAGSSFVDVPPGAFFAVPVQWMVGAGITTGTSLTTFDPYRAVTRAEAAAFLHRLAGAPSVTVDPSGECGTPVGDDIAQAEAYSLSLLNQLRISVGVAPLVSVDIMDDFARDWSRTMSEGGFFAHSGGPYGENIVWWSNENLTPFKWSKTAAEILANLVCLYKRSLETGY
jgi:hypothetical protein